MNAAILDRSPRLQRVLAVLRRSHWVTTRGIIERAHVVAVSSCVAELRQNGYDIDCHRAGDIWRYKLNRRAKA